MKTVVVTGANRGIGLEFTRQYLADGFRVIATCRQPEAADALTKLMMEHSDQLVLQPLDVADPESRKTFARWLDGRPLQLLINNAGYYGANNRLSELDDAEWQRIMAINVIGPLQLSRLLRRCLAEAGNGTIAMLTSKMGSIADNESGGAYLYRSSKAALNAAARSLSIDLRDDQIKVVLLHPGWVQTDMGGTNALIDTNTSVSGMRKVISRLKLEQSGDFYAYDGTSVPW